MLLTVEIMFGRLIYMTDPCVWGSIEQPVWVQQILFAFEFSVYFILHMCNQLMSNIPRS